jgi:hypothetical protein
MASSLAVSIGRSWALWNAIQSEFHISDVGGIELLTQCCAAKDRVDALAEQIDADGEIIRTKTGPKAHPLLREELSTRSFICRTLQRLGITDEPIKPMGRPPRGWKGFGRAD